MSIARKLIQAPKKNLITPFVLLPIFIMVAYAGLKEDDYVLAIGSVFVWLLVVLFSVNYWFQALVAFAGAIIAFYNQVWLLGVFFLFLGFYLSLVAQTFRRDKREILEKLREMPLAAKALDFLNIGNDGRFSHKWRHTVEEFDGQVKITLLPGKRNILGVIFAGIIIILMACWLGIVVLIGLLFCGIGFGVIGDGEPDTIFLVMGAFLSLFFIFGFSIFFLGIHSFFWQLSGREIVTIEPPMMTIERRIWIFGKKKGYAVNCVRDMKVSASQIKPGFVQAARKIFGRNGMIAFEYESEILRFGSDIDEAEAKQIIAVISKPSYGIYATK